MSGHTTVTMCQRLMVNIDLLKLVRAAYMGKKGFNVYHRMVECYPLDKKGVAEGKLPNNLIDVIEKAR